MKKCLFAVLLAGIVLNFFIVPPVTRAGALPVLSFHMGIGVEGRFFVGGTLHNEGDEPVIQGYLVILPVNERCEPERFVFYEFGKLAAGSSQEFRIPVSSRLVSYRLAGASAVDDMGFDLPVRDDTKAVLDARRNEELEACQNRRNSKQVQP